MTATKYAATTSVSAEKTQVDIQMLLKKHKATSVATGEQDNRAMIGFKIGLRQFRMSFSYPDPKSFARSNGRTVRTPIQQKAAYEQEVRRLWRAMFLILKGKLEALQSSIVTLEEEFLPYIVTASGQTVYEHLKFQLDSNTLLRLPEPDQED